MAEPLLIAKNGATGTGKTVTLQTLAENLSWAASGGDQLKEQVMAYINGRKPHA